MADEKRSVGVRVRPNSQDFIRLLRAELKGKQATFWVDVRAKTGQATGDVRKWAATDLKAITGFVNVRANTGEASRDVAEWRRRQSNIKTVVNVGADTSQATRQIAQLQAMARDITIKVKADTTGGRTAAERAARSAAKDVRLPDFSESKRRLGKDLDDFARQIDIGGARMAKSMADAMDKALKSKKTKIDVDASPARKTMRELLEQFGGEEVDVSVDLHTAPAEGRAAELKRNLELRNVKLEADIDLRRVRTQLAELRLQEKLKKLEVKVEVKKSSTEQVFQTLRDIEKRFGNISPIRSLNLGPINLGKPTGLLGTLTTITALAGAIPGAVTGIAALSDALVRLGGAASLAPGAIAGLVASLGTLKIGGLGVSDTFSAMFDMWTEGASKTNAYRNSVDEEAKAQRNVASARREALGEMRDLNNELRGGVLNEAQALLDLQKARDRYAQGGFGNETERLQGLLDIRKAELNVDEVREKNIRTQQKADEANTKQVEGSDRVLDALAGLAQAQNNGTAATSKFNDMLAQLSPNAQEYVKTIAGMKGELFAFKNELQDVLFEGLGPAFEKTFDSIAPVVEPGMKRIAAAMNDNLVQIFDTISSPDGQSIIERILGGTEQAQQAIGKLINPLITGVGTFVAASTEHLPQVIDLFTRLADRFALFIEEADKSGSLDKFLDKGVDALADMAETGINLVKIINDLSSAFGGDLIGSLSEATGKLHEYLSSAEGQAKLNELFQQARDVWEEWKPTLQKLPAIFDAVSDAARTLLEIIMPVIETITGFMKENPGLVEGFIAGWLGVKVLSGVFSPFITIMGVGLKLSKSLLGVLEKLPGASAATAGLLNKIPGVAGVGAGATGGGLLAAAGGLAGGAYAGYDAYQAFQNGDGILSGLGLGAASLGLNLTGLGPAADFLGISPSSDGGGLLNPTRTSQEQINKVGEWIKAGADGPDKKKRAEWVKANYKGGDFSPPDSYMSGGPHTGYTPWGAKQGKMAELHGGEYVEPKHVVDFYGKDAMEAIHQKRVPKQFLGSFDEGGMVYDPVSGRMVPSDTPVAHGAAPGGPGILNTVLNAGVGIATAFGNQAAGAAQSAVGQIGTAGTGTGALPGPVDGLSGALPPPLPGPPSGGVGSGFLSGLGIPGLGGDQKGTSGPGWGPQGPPVGLGGIGSDGKAFDIRKFGIGPGPAGSGPFDWATKTGEILGKFGSGLITTLAGAVGLGGVLGAVQKGGGLASHFFSSDDDSIQDPNADKTNSDVSNLLGVYGGMPGNPAYPGMPNLPGVVNGATGTALGGGGGLQVNTARGEQIIKSKFPWATDIGGVRADALKWHPSGLALDVMIPGAGGLNDPTPPMGKAEGDQLYAWLMANKEALGIDYIMWQQPDHFNHLHVNFAPSGYGPGGGPSIALPAPSPAQLPGFGGAAPSGGAGRNFVVPPSGGSGPDAAWKNMSDRDRRINVAIGLYRPDGTPIPKDQRQPMNGAPVGNPAQKPPMQDPGLAPVGIPEGWKPPPLDAPSVLLPSTSNGPMGPVAIPPQLLPRSGKPTDLSNLPWPEGIPRPPEFTRDKGGYLPTGTSIVHNFTGKPELVVNGPQEQMVRSFYGGGFNTGVILPPPQPVIPAPPPPRTDIIPMTPQPVTPKPLPPPTGNPPPVVPVPPPMNQSPPTAGPGAAPPPAQGQGPNGMPFAPSDRPATGSQPGSYDHVHPALQKGITSGFAVAGSLASQAINAAVAAGTMGASGAAGGMGGGQLGSFVQGLFTQAGKITTNVANVASSFLVGNITGGTTSNPYGVTQRTNVPSGGTKVVDASSTHVGDVYTNDLDAYFAREDRRKAQREQGQLGRWGNE